MSSSGGKMRQTLEQLQLSELTAAAVGAEIDDRLPSAGGASPARS